MGTVRKSKTLQEPELRSLPPMESEVYFKLKLITTSFTIIAKNKRRVKKMDRKKVLKQQYREIPIEAGIYTITNKKNGKVCVVSTRNFKTINGVKFSLENGGYANKKLVEEWKEYGKDAFSFEIVEVLKPKEDPYYNEKEELAKLEDKWLDKLLPFGEKGYNNRKN